MQIKDFPAAGVGAWSSHVSDWHKIGHFTQVAWAKTTRVGCGAIVSFPASGKYNYVSCTFVAVVLASPLYCNLMINPIKLMILENHLQLWDGCKLER